MLSPNARLFLITLFEYHSKGERLRTTYLAEKLNISKPAVTEISRVLSAEGYINYQPYQPYRLTEAGEKLAAALFERIGTIEKYYFIHFNLTPFRARTEALKSEPCISDTITRAMQKSIPAPEIGLFGQILSAPLPFQLKTLLHCSPESVVQPVAIKAQTSYNQQFWLEIAAMMGKSVLIHSFENEIEAIQIIFDNEPRHVSFKLAEKILVAI